MPYLEGEVTNVGDITSDKVLMAELGATLQQKFGSPHSYYQAPYPPRTVLNKLERCGYRVVATSGIGQTCVWTLHKQD